MRFSVGGSEDLADGNRDPGRRPAFPAMMGIGPGDRLGPGSGLAEPPRPELVVVDITADAARPGPCPPVAGDTGGDGRACPADGSEAGLRLADVVQEGGGEPPGVGVRSERGEGSPGRRDRLGSIGTSEALPARKLLLPKRSPDERVVGRVERTRPQ